MDTQKFDGKTLFLINAGKPRFGTMTSDGRTVTLKWPAEARDSGEVTEWGCLRLQDKWLPDLKRNDQGKTINFGGQQTPDYYYPADAFEKWRPEG
jgi:hypothetical protein